MSNSTVARRYAQALYQEAEGTGTTEQVDADFVMIGESLDASRELVLFFDSPIISREKKEAVVTALFAKRLQPTTLSFLRLLIRKGREDLFPEMVQAYHSLRDEQIGIQTALARVALPLGASEEKNLVQALEAMTGKRIRLQVELDPDIIGGMIIRVGDTVYDGSLSNRLSGLRERLERGSMMTN